MDPAPHDRPLSERRIAVYRSILARNEFRPCVWAKAFCGETDQWYRVNGKHTSTMLSALDEIPEFYVTVEEYSCDTLEDIAKLYATYDSKLAARTTSDINRTFAASVPELANMNIRVINLAVSGIAYRQHLDAYSSIPAAERAEAILDKIDFTIFLDQIIQSGQARPLSRIAVAAAIYGTWERNRKLAEAFWCSVRDETGERPDLPDRRLAKYLTTISVNNGQGASGPRSRRETPRAFFVKCIHAWNAWRKGEKTELKYYIDAKVPAIQ